MPRQTAKRIELLPAASCCCLTHNRQSDASARRMRSPNKFIISLLPLSVSHLLLLIHCSVLLQEASKASKLSSPNGRPFGAEKLAKRTWKAAENCAKSSSPPPSRPKGQGEASRRVSKTKQDCLGPHLERPSRACLEQTEATHKQTARISRQLERNQPQD